MLEDLRDYGLIWQRKVQCLLRLKFQIVDTQLRRHRLVVLALRA